MYIGYISLVIIVLFYYKLTYIQGMNLFFVLYFSQKQYTDILSLEDGCLMIVSHQGYIGQSPKNIKEQNSSEIGIHVVKLLS